MSQRSIIEINHDYSHEIEKRPVEFMRMLGYALASGSDANWKLLEGFGVRRIIQRHHSSSVKVVVTTDHGLSVERALP